MPAEHDTLTLINHIDQKFTEANRDRTAALKDIHAKIDSQGEKIARIDTTLALHIENTNARFDERDDAEEKADERKDTWMRTGATIVLGGGALSAVWGWFKEHVLK